MKFNIHEYLNLKNKIMKTHLRKLVLIAGLAIATIDLKAQLISDFENLTLAAGTYWNGSDLSGSFSSGSATFLNNYNMAWGSWDGFAYSNISDSTTAGYTNQYAARTGVGYNNSANYAVANYYGTTKIRLSGAALGAPVAGFYVTNATYAAISMRDGDAFARKFGDTTGTGSGLAQGAYPDWFKLSVTGYRTGVVITDTVHFYLADYRFSNNALDYIVTTWQWVDLTSLGNLDSVLFSLSSSDVGAWGMNTPAYFCMDDFTAALPTSIISANDHSGSSLQIYPNPASENIYLNLTQSRDTELQVKIVDVTGKMVYSSAVSNGLMNLNISNFENGIYFLNVSGENTNINQKIIKQ